MSVGYRLRKCKLVSVSLGYVTHCISEFNLHYENIYLDVNNFLTTSTWTITRIPLVMQTWTDFFFQTKRKESSIWNLTLILTKKAEALDSIISSRKKKPVLCVCVFCFLWVKAPRHALILIEKFLHYMIVWYQPTRLKDKRTTTKNNKEIKHC